MKRFGLIGYPLGHSFSKKYFTDKFQNEGLQDHLYETFPIEDILSVKEILRAHPDLAGFNVTIPHKETIVALLDEYSPVVEKIRACNCVLVRDGKLIGYNTDVLGFQQSLQKSFPVLPSKALILGTGGAAKAVEYVLGQLNIGYKLVSRKPSTHNLSYEQVTPAVINEHKLIINTTPLGMYPRVVEAPPIPYEALGGEHCLFDLIYNPERTLFLQKGAEQGAAVQNGWEMLVIQAEESWKIWSAPQ